MRGNSHVQCGAGEKIETSSKSYLSLLDTTQGNDLMGTFIADLVLQLLSFVSQTERDFIRQRQSEGIAAAKARGVRFGAPVKEGLDDFTELYKLWLTHEEPTYDLIRKSGLSKSTFYRRVRAIYKYSCQKNREVLLSRKTVAAGTADLEEEGLCC